MKSIVLFKTKKENDDYEKVFQENGWLDIRFIPLLTIRYNCNSQLIINELQNGQHKFLIITSNNATISLCNLLLNNDCLIEDSVQISLLKSFLELDSIYMVGETSKNTLQHTLQQLKSKSNEKIIDLFNNQNQNKQITKYITKDNSLILANSIIADNLNGGHSCYLYLCGNIRKDDLPNQLLESHINFKEIIVYENIQNQNTNNNNNDQLNTSISSSSSNGSSNGSNLELDIVLHQNIYCNPPEWMVFFSPSGIDTFINHYDKGKIYQFTLDGPVSMRKIKIASIGTTTFQHLTNNNIRCDVVSKSPNAQSLLQSILNNKEF